MMSNKICAITGATGFLGRNISNKMSTAGWSVLRLQRQEKIGAETANDIIPFKLGAKIDPSHLKGVDLLIHCAYDFSCTDWNKVKEINIEGTKTLFEAALSAGVNTLVYISSMHAFKGCRTMYGKAKLDVEEYVIGHGGIIIRPGTLYIEQDGKLYGGLRGETLQLFETLFRSTPVVPILYSREPTIYTTHIDDLCDLIKEVISRKDLIDKPICAVNMKPMTIKQFLIKIKERQHKKRVFFIPVPWQIPWLLLMLLERINIKLSFRSEAIMGFIDQNPKPDFSMFKLLKTQMRSFD